MLAHLLPPSRRGRLRFELVNGLKCLGPINDSRTAAHKNRHAHGLLYLLPRGSGSERIMNENQAAVSLVPTDSRKCAVSVV
jgi:hypothetical protein